MPCPYQTPEEAVTGFIEAYRTFDIDEIVRNKDFEADARIFFEGMGLPVSPEQIFESVRAFETNFRKQISEGIPDYRAVTFDVAGEERPQADFAVVTLAGVTAKNQHFQLRIPVFQTRSGWKVVLHSAYDQL